MHSSSAQAASHEGIRHLRGHIGRMDAEPAALLERRDLVATEVQRLDPAGCSAGRDTDRGRALAEHTVEHAPRLRTGRLAAVTGAAITTGLSAAQEAAGPADP